MNKKKRCENRRRSRRCFPIFPCPPKRCQRQRPKPRPRPIPQCIVPLEPEKYPSNLIVEKECCGNILIQGIQPVFQIWETDIDSNISVVQISIYSNPSSTDTLEIEINSEERKLLYIPPGNTTNFVGQGIKSIMISSQGSNSTYIEGKYNILTTFQLHRNHVPVKEQ
ncbi:S-Ena type endospore appendage [Paenibacillus sp. FA6]|uniref:S-Ena type endospore appendage n=1 Tax=Paenibacillus sp. FA6 TaxID=3413029 RepID=UPI003F655A4D